MLEGYSWLKFNNLESAVGMGLKFYTSIEKELKQKVRKRSGLIPTFVEVTGEKLVEGPFYPSPNPKLGQSFKRQLLETLK